MTFLKNRRVLFVTVFLLAMSITNRVTTQIIQNIYRDPQTWAEQIAVYNIHGIVQELLVAGIIIVASGSLRDPGKFGHRIWQTICGLLLVAYSFISNIGINLFYEDPAPFYRFYSLAHSSHILANYINATTVFIGAGLIIIAIRRDILARRIARTVVEN